MIICSWTIRANLTFDTLSHAELIAIGPSWTPLTLSLLCLIVDIARQAWNWN